MHRRGVTLIELLIVMIIIAILSVVIFVSLMSSVDEAREASLTRFQADMNTTLPQWTAYYIKNASPKPGNYEFMPGGSIRTAVVAETLHWFRWYNDFRGSEYLSELPVDTFYLYIRVPNGRAEAQCIRNGVSLNENP